MSGPRALQERGLSSLQFQQDLRTLVKAWGTPAKLGAELGCSAASIDNQMKGYQPPTAPMAERLYGPGKGNRLIARGPDARPVERKWVQEEPVSVGEDLDDTPTGADFDDEPDDVDTGAARILAACGKRPEPESEPEEPARETDPDFLDHQLAEKAEVPAEVAQPEECDASSAEGAGSTPALRSFSPDDDAEAAIEAAGAAMREGHLAPQVCGIVQIESAPGHFAMAEQAPMPVLAEVLRPWSKVPDGDFVVIARGKLAGLEADLVALDRRHAALRLEELTLQAERVEAEQKAEALRRTIEIFTGEESENGDGCAAQAAE